MIERYRTEVVPRQVVAARRGAARRLLALAHSLEIEPSLLTESSPSDRALPTARGDALTAVPQDKHKPHRN